MDPHEIYKSLGPMERQYFLYKISKFIGPKLHSFWKRSINWYIKQINTPNLNPGSVWDR